MVDSAGKAAHRSSAMAEEWSVPVLFPPQRPRVVVKADLLPAVSVLSTAALLGIPLGWLWSLLAPAERVRVIGTSGQLAPLELESWHRFDDLAVFGFLAMAAGLLIGLVVWFLRERRGPVVLAAAAGGALVAAWLGTQMGPAFANAKYSVDAPPALGTVIEQAPRIETGWVVLAAPLVTCLVYALMTAWNGREDLGRRLG
ncbi:DUF2567 domain-containing protein [Amycolatopsis rubida]|uniref:DUF2567 domain-containing protein n=2 Tax=Pseudonocardiaceae TaxID=2070 RepID=A0A1I5YLJ4_9PSEU|nr:DUF2567 domain-containing protein [Amycolatopsis rubida]MYW95003.1 DUF2567 domain-containing protein [Amycolatopsis rubida]NEC59990.1 DUF2567 domain-containing protein [Amycolatopsis rubida]SFQ44965.1 Protein of unknown function [Amycolatopsis rubida]